MIGRIRREYRPITVPLADLVIEEGIPTEKMEEIFLYNITETEIGRLLYLHQKADCRSRALYEMQS